MPLDAPLRYALEKVAPVREDEPLSRHTTIGVGGPADGYLGAGPQEELARVLRPPPPARAPPPAPSSGPSSPSGRAAPRPSAPASPTSTSAVSRRSRAAATPAPSSRNRPRATAG